MDYIKPTPIQQYSIPIIIGNRDLMSCSHSASGKTLAYLLPIIHCIIQRNKFEPYRKPVALVIAPTKELVEQVLFALTFTFY